jgi:hypothetical protein
MSTRVAVIAAVLGVIVAACVDVESGEMGVYGSPCGSSFHELLLCDREAGGADPGAGGGPGGEQGDGPATCADACEVLVACQGGSVPECTAECTSSMPSQSLLQCIVDMGCAFESCIPQDTP